MPTYIHATKRPQSVRARVTKNLFSPFNLQNVGTLSSSPSNNYPRLYTHRVWWNILSIAPDTPLLQRALSKREGLGQDCIFHFRLARLAAPTRSAAPPRQNSPELQQVVVVGGCTAAHDRFVFCTRLCLFFSSLPLSRFLFALTLSRPFPLLLPDFTHEICYLPLRAAEYLFPASLLELPNFSFLKSVFFFLFCIGGCIRSYLLQRPLIFLVWKTIS